MTVYIVTIYNDAMSERESYAAFSDRSQAEALVKLLDPADKPEIAGHVLDAMANMVEKRVYIVNGATSYEAIGWVPHASALVEVQALVGGGFRVASTWSHDHARTVAEMMPHETYVQSFCHWLPKKYLDTPDSGGTLGGT